MFTITKLTITSVNWFVSLVFFLYCSIYAARLTDGPTIFSITAFFVILIFTTINTLIDFDERGWRSTITSIKESNIIGLVLAASVIAISVVSLLLGGFNWDILAFAGALTLLGPAYVSLRYDELRAAALVIALGPLAFLSTVLYGHVIIAILSGIIAAGIFISAILWIPETEDAFKILTGMVVLLVVAGAGAYMGGAGEKISNIKNIESQKEQLEIQYSTLNKAPIPLYVIKGSDDIPTKTNATTFTTGGEIDGQYVEIHMLAENETCTATNDELRENPEEVVLCEPRGDGFVLAQQENGQQTSYILYFSPKAGEFIKASFTQLPRAQIDQDTFFKEIKNSLIPYKLPSKKEFINP